MGDKILYLQVEVTNNDGDYSGQVNWPKSTEELSEFISQEWFENPVKCLNHFGTRGWRYVETIENEVLIRLLFVKVDE